jgi:hypothetical protein
MKKQTDIPESLRDEMRQAVRSRWAKTTRAQRTEFAKMLWARRVRKHQQAASAVRVPDTNKVAVRKRMKAEIIKQAKT